MFKPLSPQAPLASLALIIDGGGRFAYTPMSFANTVWVYAIDAANGALTPVAGSPFAAGRTPYSVTVHPRRRIAYVTNLMNDTISTTGLFSVLVAKTAGMHRRVAPGKLIELTQWLPSKHVHSGSAKNQDCVTP